MMFASLPTSNVPEILLLRVSTFTSSYSLTTAKTCMHLTDDINNRANLINHSRGIKSLEKGFFFFFSIFFFGNCYLNQFIFVSWYVRYRYASLLRFWLAANSGGISDALMSVKEAKNKKQKTRSKKQKSKKQEAKKQKSKNQKTKNRKTEKQKNRKQKNRKTENTKQKNTKKQPPRYASSLALGLSVSLHSAALHAISTPVARTRYKHVCWVLPQLLRTRIATLLVAMLRSCVSGQTRKFCTKLCS